MTCPHGLSAERRRLSRPAGAPLQRGEGVKIPRHGRPNTFHGLSAERKSLAIGRKRRKKPHAARRYAAPSHVPHSLSGGCPFAPLQSSGGSDRRRGKLRVKIRPPPAPPSPRRRPDGAAEKHPTTPAPSCFSHAGKRLWKNLFIFAPTKNIQPMPSFLIPPLLAAASAAAPPATPSS